MTLSPSSLPALLGGPAVRPQGPPPWPPADEEVLQALQEAFRDGSWGKYHGQYVKRLEERLAEYFGVEFSLTCASGTFAVELALRALRVGAGDEVITAAYDYPGNFLSVHAVGATPVLVDVAAGNWNLDPAALVAARTAATRAIIVSHLHGGMAPMREVMDFAAAHGLRVVEDAAQVPGGLIQGRKAGTWGDAGVLSFGGSKLLSAGRGGALVTHHADVYQRARAFEFRGNILSPLSELQAAVLLPQLARLDARNAQRAANAKQLVEALRDIAGLRPFVNACADAEPAYYKLGFQFDAAAFGLSRARFIDACRAEGIAFDAGFRAAHVGRSPNRFRAAGDLSQAERAHEGTVVLHHPVLLGSAGDLCEVTAAVTKVRQHASLLAG
jgi:perosamine synthetase